MLVVDDYSSDPVEQVVAEHRRKGDEIDFFLHRKKCGIAEIAFFASLRRIRISAVIEMRNLPSGLGTSNRPL